MKKIVSFILAAVMVLSMMVVGVSAAEKEEITNTTRSVDFEKQTVGAKYNRNGEGWTLNNGAGDNTEIMEDSGNKYAKANLAASNANVWAYPGDFWVRSFKMTFDFMMPQQATSSYYGFYLHANRFESNSAYMDESAEFLVIVQPKEANNYVKGQTTVNGAFKTNQWYTMEFVRDGVDVELRLWEKGSARPEAALLTTQLPEDKNGNICPAIQNINRDSAAQVIYFDNMVATTPYKIVEENDTAFAPEAGKTLYTSDFESGDFTAPFKTGGTASNVERGVQSETDNKYFAAKYITSGATTSNTYIVPGGYTSDAYVYSGDLKWDVNDKISGGYYGLYIKTGAGEDALMVLLFGKKDTISVIKTADAALSQSRYEVAGGVGTYQKWLSFEMVRIGTNVSFTLWEKGTQKPAVATITYKTYETAAEPIMQFSFNSATDVNATMAVDNLKIATIPTVDCVAAQTTGGLDANNQYAVRFISTVNDLNFAKAGFEIVATPANGAAKQFEASTNTVYNSIIASDELGIKAEYTAAELGGKYLVAVGIKDIPDGLGNVTFTVKPFCENLAGERTYGAEKTLTVNNGVAVIS